MLGSLTFAVFETPTYVRQSLRFFTDRHDEERAVLGRKVQGYLANFTGKLDN